MWPQSLSMETISTNKSRLDQNKQNMYKVNEKREFYSTDTFIAQINIEYSNRLNKNMIGQ